MNPNVVVPSYHKYKYSPTAHVNILNIIYRSHSATIKYTYWAGYLGQNWKEFVMNMSMNVFNYVCVNLWISVNRLPCHREVFEELVANELK